MQAGKAEEQHGAARCGNQEEKWFEKPLRAPVPHDYLISFVIKKQRLVIVAELISGFAVAILRRCIRFIDEQTNCVRTFQQKICELRHATRAETVSPVLRADINAFEIDDLGRLADDISLEFQVIIFYGHPGSAQINSPGAALAKTAGINIKRIDTAFFKS